MNVVEQNRVLQTALPKNYLATEPLRGSALGSGNDVTTVNIPAKSGTSFSQGQDVQFEISDPRRLANLQDAYIRAEFEVDFTDATGKAITQSVSGSTGDWATSLYGTGSTCFSEYSLDLITMRVENIRYYNHYSTSQMAIFNSARGNLAKLIENFGVEGTGNNVGMSLLGLGKRKNTFIHYPNSAIMQMFSAYPTSLAPVTLTYRLENVDAIFRRVLDNSTGNARLSKITGYRINNPELMVKMTTPRPSYVAKMQALLEHNHLEYPLKLVQTHISNGLNSTDVKVALSVGVNKSVADMRTVFISKRKDYENPTVTPASGSVGQDGYVPAVTTLHPQSDTFQWSHEGLSEWSISPDISTQIPQGKPFTRWDALAQIINAFDPLEPKLTTGSDKFLGTWRSGEAVGLDADIERSTIFNLYYSFKQSNEASSSEIFGDGLSTSSGIIYLNLKFQKPLPAETRIVTWVTVERILRLGRNSVSTVAWWETA